MSLRHSRQRARDGGHQSTRNGLLLAMRGRENVCSRARDLDLDLEMEWNATGTIDCFAVA